MQTQSASALPAMCALHTRVSTALLRARPSNEPCAQGGGIGNRAGAPNPRNHASDATPQAQRAEVCRAALLIRFLQRVPLGVPPCLRQPPAAPLPPLEHRRREPVVRAKTQMHADPPVPMPWRHRHEKHLGCDALIRHRRALLALAQVTHTHAHTQLRNGDVRGVAGAGACARPAGSIWKPTKSAL